MRRTCVVVLFFVSYFTFNAGSGDIEKDAVGHITAYTEQGRIRGNTYPFLNTTVNVFWSIPFAEPPVGDLRFQHPVPKSAWSDILDGTRRPNACYQADNDTWMLNVPESEDCLYLNVFVPGTVTVFNENSSVNACAEDGYSTKDLRPVMFYIYGGGFNSGASSIERYNGSALAVQNEVIVVTFNYRLGAFGFLYSGSDEAPGNAGIYDQLAALRWVHDNIRCFGGDPNDVTIFGNSAGSFSVGYMILSGVTRGLFQKAIMMSGAPLGVQQMHTLQNYEPFIKVLSEATNCSERLSLLEMTACLKLVPAEDFNVAQKTHRHVIRRHWPVMDSDFFESLNSSSGGFDEAAEKNLSVLVGVVENEGALFLDRIMPNMSISRDVLRSALDLFLTDPWYMHVGNSHQKLAAHHMYTNWDDANDEDANRRNLCDFIGDSIIVCSSIQFAKELFKKGVNVYYYVFNERPSISQMPDWAGTTHADELHFVFGHPLDRSKGYNIEEAEASRRIMRIFGSVARYGIPGFQGLHSWPRYTTDGQLYVQLNANGQHEMKKGPRAFHCGLWNNLLIKLTEGC